MSTTWLKNMAGIHQTDLELLQVPNPKLELTIHITTKTVQTGAFVGSLLVGPLIHLIKNGTSGSTRALKQEVVSGGIAGSLFGLATGPLLSGLYMKRCNDIELYDICYRLRFNDRQLNTDRAFYVASTLGSAVGGPSGYVFGANFSILASTLLNAMRRT